MTNAEIPMGRQAARAWKRLDAGVRKEVWRRARQGLGHPDPAVASMAMGGARYTLSRSFCERYWARMVVVLIGALGAAALLNRLISPDPNLYVIAVIASLSSGIITYTKARLLAEQMEEANTNTLRAAPTDHESVD